MKKTDNTTGDAKKKTPAIKLLKDGNLKYYSIRTDKFGLATISFASFCDKTEKTDHSVTAFFFDEKVKVSIIVSEIDVE